MQVARLRATFVALAVGTIVVGLLVHRVGGFFGPVARDMIGDALWAVMIAWWMGALAPRARLWVRSVAAYTVCVVVELSQILHAPALDAIRTNRLGRLVVGSGFDPRDLVAYALGVGTATLLTAVVVARSRAAP